MYMYPCDKDEQQRMDYLHALFEVARRKELHEHPIISNDGPPRILDLGCGTGLWVWGMDLVKIIPPMTPPNTRWRLHRDYESPWGLGENSFDLVHLRLGCGSVSNWHDVYSSAFRHIKPHTGRFEQIELDLEPRCDDGTLPENATIRKWYDALKRATQLFNRPIAYNHATPQMLAAQGFVDVQHRSIRVPLSTWPTGAAMTERRLADFYALALLDDKGLESYSLGPLTRYPVSWPVEDVERYCEETANEIRNRNYHMYHVMHIITARKP
ncbi:MAG: hypothetical protein Q9180_002876 [Flavoplaca navasiana]